MKSRSVFLIAFLWWLVAAAFLGAIYPLVTTLTDGIFMTGSASQFTEELWRTVVNASVLGVVYGVPGALLIAGFTTWLRRKRRVVSALTQLLAGLWTIAVLWLMPEISDDLGERVAVTASLALIAWALAPAIVDRYRSQLGDPLADMGLEMQPVRFTPVHMLTSNAHSDDVEAFVRSSLRTHGRGNALFTLSADAATSNTHTEVLIDASGTGHVLNLAIKKWATELADGAAALPGFTLTDDRSLAIAPAGLSAPAVVSEGIALVQSISGSEMIKVQFDGFGH